MYKQTLSNDFNLIKYHVVRPSDFFLGGGDIYVEIHSKIRLCIIYQFAKDPWKHQAGL